MQTSESEKDVKDIQIAKYIYATNKPFSAVEDRLLCKLMIMLRTAYRPPFRYWWEITQKGPGNNDGRLQGTT